MRIVKRLIAKLDDPKTAKKIHGTLAVGWFIWAFPSMLTGLKSSVPYLVFLSVYAIVAAHWSGWDSAGGEVEIEKMQEEQ